MYTLACNFTFKGAQKKTKSNKVTLSMHQLMMLKPSSCGSCSGSK